MINIKIRLITFFAVNHGEALHSKSKTRSRLWLRASTHYGIFRLKLKKVRKTTRPFIYDLDQIPYDYILKVTNRFKGLHLIERVLKNYGWRFMTLYRRQ